MTSRIATHAALLTPFLATLAASGTAGATAPECDSDDPIDRAICSAGQLRESLEKSAEQQHRHDMWDPGSYANTPLWWALPLIGIGLFMLLKGPGEARKDAGPGHAGAAKAELAGGGIRWLGAVLIGVGATIGVARFGGVGPAVVAGIITGVIAMIGWAKVSGDEPAMRGYDLAHHQWQQQQWEAQQNPVAPQDPYAHLRGRGIPLPPQPAPVVQQVPEPILTPEQAASLYQQSVEADGWNPPEGSALKAVTSVDGKIQPAVAAVSKVSRDLGWGRQITGEDGQLWDSWVRAVGVAAVASGDAQITLQVLHSSITAETLEKHLPALVRALKVRAGSLDRDIASGGYTLTVTNQKPAAPASGGGRTIDPEWS
ncbi:hypothetical protein [Mycobacterium sp. SMC-19]|uniref:hypothetical protein n=1 Tax=Mycobacterium sp. SMC-19 TaxID=3381630 RepID=UPI003875CD65